MRASGERDELDVVVRPCPFPRPRRVGELPASERPQRLLRPRRHGQLCLANAPRAPVLLSAIRYLLLRRSFRADPVRVRAGVRDLGEPARPDPGAGHGAGHWRSVPSSDCAPAPDAGSTRRQPRGAAGAARSLGLHGDLRAAPLAPARRHVRLSSGRPDDPALARGVLLSPHAKMALACGVSRPPRYLPGGGCDHHHRFRSLPARLRENERRAVDRRHHGRDGSSLFHPRDKGDRPRLPAQHHGRRLGVPVPLRASGRLDGRDRAHPRAGSAGAPCWWPFPRWGTHT